MRTLHEVARVDPRLIALCCVDALQTSLERNTRNVPRDGRFHVRVHGRIIFSGSFAAARDRYDRALQTRRRRKVPRPASPARRRLAAGALPRLHPASRSWRRSRWPSANRSPLLPPELNPDRGAPDTALECSPTSPKVNPDLNRKPGPAPVE